MALLARYGDNLQRENPRAELGSCFKTRQASEESTSPSIAGAGKAAHLPGMCAACFEGPVIGIPMKTSDLGGVDSLYSIVQMPTGVPVATVAINGGGNAGILAVKMLAMNDSALAGKLHDFIVDQKESVESKDAKLQTEGYKAFL